MKELNWESSVWYTRDVDLARQEHMERFEYLIHKAGKGLIDYGFVFTHTRRHAENLVKHWSHSGWTYELKPEPKPRVITWDVYS